LLLHNKTHSQMPLHKTSACFYLVSLSHFYFFLLVNLVFLFILLRNKDSVLLLLSIILLHKVVDKNQNIFVNIKL
jgi:hypothetical protein